MKKKPIKSNSFTGETMCLTKSGRNYILNKVNIVDGNVDSISQTQGDLLPYTKSQAVAWLEDQISALRSK